MARFAMFPDGLQHERAVFFLVILLSATRIHAAEGPLCYSCKDLPHPRDCDRITQCAPSESCSVASYLTTSGSLFYNSGCLDKRQCVATLTGRSASRDNVSSEIEAGRASRDIELCSECCGSNYCNRKLCDTTAPPDTNIGLRTCLSCQNVLDPKQCFNVVLCNVGEMCYTEFMRINKEYRYRLGCINPHQSCSNEATVSQLIGRRDTHTDDREATRLDDREATRLDDRRFLVNDDIDTSRYCGKCCYDDVGNCNRNICIENATLSSPGLHVSTLTKPPERRDFCEDITPTSCQLLGYQDPNFCFKPNIANFACREFCGTCVNKGHQTAAPNTGSSSQNNLPPTDCFYSSQRYKGAYTSTISGKTCLAWEVVLTSQDPLAAGMPDTSLTFARNKCRDPDGRGHPWCFTSTSNEWEYCPVPYCAECYYRNASRSYNGYLTITESMSTCESWTNNRQIPITDKNFPMDASIESAENYCRDAYDFGVPGCWSEGRFQKCNISICETPCEDDPRTNCSLVQKYICEDEYTRHTLCPKTCNACNFGLQPPKAVDPPNDLCEDNPAANCQVLKDYVCDDPNGALEFCPKTCKKCSIIYANAFSTTMATPTTPMPVPTTPQPAATQDTVGTSSAPTVTTTRTSTVLATTTQAVTTIQTTPDVTTGGSTEVTTTGSAYHWLEWSEYQCTVKDGACIRARVRNCSSGVVNDCSGNANSVNLCTAETCPEYYNHSIGLNTTADQCFDKDGLDCSTAELRDLICYDPDLAEQFCPKSCRLCGPDACTDFLNCTDLIKSRVCSESDLAVKYCRRSCKKCDEAAVPVDVNECGDPVSDVSKCKFLDDELHVCTDPVLVVLCQNYCTTGCNTTTSADFIQSREALSEDRWLAALRYTLQ